MGTLRVQIFVQNVCFWIVALAAASLTVKALHHRFSFWLVLMILLDAGLLVYNRMVHAKLVADYEAERATLEHLDSYNG